MSLESLVKMFLDFVQTVSWQITLIVLVYIFRHKIGGILDAIGRRIESIVRARASSFELELLPPEHGIVQRVPEPLENKQTD